MKGPGAVSRAVRTVVVLIAVMLVAGVALELAFVSRHPGDIPAHQVVSFLYLVPSAVAFTVVGIAVIGHRPAHPIGWLFVALALEGGSAILANGYTAWDLPGSDWVTWTWVLVRGPAYGILALALLLFPSGSPVSPRWQPVLRVEQGYVAVALLLAVFAPWQIEPYPNLAYMGQNPIGLFGSGSTGEMFDLLDGLGALVVLASLVSLVVRWRSSSGVERQQVKWMALAALVFGMVALVGVGWLLVGEPTAGSEAAFVVGDGIFQLAVTAMPVAMGFGIARYRLYDIDRLISRTLVFGALAAFIGVAYVAGVVLVGEALIGHALTRGAGASALVGLAVTAVVAVAFHPLRVWLQTRADRWVFGEKAAPYELMAGLAGELARAVAPSVVLSRIARTAGEAVRADAARASVVLPDGRTVTACWGDADPSVRGAFDVSVPVQDGTDTLGEIAVAGGSGRPGEIEVISRIVGVSAAAMRNLRLLAELETLYQAMQDRNRQIASSRSRLILAADEERRYLQHLLAERLDPGLTRLREVLPELLRQVVDRPEHVACTCERLVTTATSLVEEIRAVSRGVLPPVLADHGLVAAVRASLRRLDVAATLDVDPAIGMVRYPPHVEATAFLCCRAALDDAAAAGATALTVQLGHRDGHLSFSVTHAGGHRADDAGATDLVTARDRIACLGGDLRVDHHHGFRVVGTVPVDVLSRDGSSQPTSLRNVSTA